MTSETCPRFTASNAAVCPIAQDWQRHEHLPGETACKYLTDSAKAGAAERYAADPVFAVVAPRRDLVCSKHPTIAATVARAALTGFAGGNLVRQTCPGSLPNDLRS